MATMDCRDTGKQHPECHEPWAQMTVWQGAAESHSPHHLELRHRFVLVLTLKMVCSSEDCDH